MKIRQLSRITSRLLSWYDHHARDLPWRRTDDPYHIWVSEIMLQQTQVETVIPYYRHFLERFPTVHALAEASLDEVLKIWEGMGYYARARNLHTAAKRVVESSNGQVPDTWDALVQLPGIGVYTAGAILSIAFHQRVPAVDGNTRRVLSRLYAIQKPLDQRSTQQTLQKLAEALVPAENPGRFNQALMDLGAAICTPQRPACSLCPLNDLCDARRQGLQESLPVTTKRKPLPHFDVTAGVIWRSNGQLLIAQRPADGLLGGLWEFPGGKQEQGESLKVCLKREIWEELGIEISVGEHIASIDHAYTHFRITLHAFHCRHQAGAPQNLGCAGWRWVTLDDLEDFAFPKVDREIIKALQRLNVERGTCNPFYPPI